MLCHRLGERNVFSVDIDADLVALAGQHLARIGYHLTLVAVDGEEGLADHSPYDRVIATCSVPAVPWAWAEQTREGGLILVDVKAGLNAGNLVALHRFSDRLEGRFLPQWGRVASPDGSWCEIDHDTHDGQHRVFEAGSHQLRQTVEDAHQLWQATGQPGWDRFGLTVTQDHHHRIWLDTPHSPKNAWDLPVPATTP